MEWQSSAITVLKTERQTSATFFCVRPHLAFFTTFYYQIVLIRFTMLLCRLLPRHCTPPLFNEKFPTELNLMKKLTLELLLLPQNNHLVACVPLGNAPKKLPYSCSLNQVIIKLTNFKR